MPSDESILEQAQKFKATGNDAFAKGEYASAAASYSQGIVAVDRIPDVPDAAALKTTLLSNRSACYLKIGKVQEAVDDCTLALEHENPKLRIKLLFKRAKGRFLLAQNQNQKENLEGAAKDLLRLLTDDPKNKEATTLLQTIRVQAAAANKETPIAKTLSTIQEKEGNERIHHIKVLMGLLHNDPISGSMEFGRRGGVQQMLDLANEGASHLALQALAAAASHPPFVRDSCAGIQKQLMELCQKNDPDITVGALSIYLRLILHLDRDGPEDEEITGTTQLDYDCVLKTCALACQSGDPRSIRASLDILSSFTAGKELDNTIRASLDESLYPKWDGLPPPKSMQEIRHMKPKEMAAYKKRKYHRNLRNEAWAFERAMLFCRDYLSDFLKVALTEDHALRREVTVVLGRVLSSIEEEDKLKGAVKPYLRDRDEDEGVTIEEVYNEDDEKDDGLEEVLVGLDKQIERAELVAALLLAKAEVGAWAFSSGWENASNALSELINSQDDRAMCMASECISAAATVADARGKIHSLVEAGTMEKLLMSENRDIRSGAASAVAKLGLSEKVEEGDSIAMLQVCVDLLGDESDTARTSELMNQLPASGAATATERGVEMLNYLATKTAVKEEVAHGFCSSSDTNTTALEMLVKVADKPEINDTAAGYALANIFSNMAVTNETVRREAFEGKEFTMEEYDEMQKLGKTPEQLEEEAKEKEPDDDQKSCDDRIRKMAKANVPRALVQLMDGASESTMLVVVTAMNRMAVEPSVRGVMIQQGVLSSCIKIEKEEQKQTDEAKKILRVARHCIGKLLTTMNPALLTSAQRMGSIKSLIQLIRDIESKDLQKFEALLAVTNIASFGDDTKNRIVAEKGIGTLHFAMFSDHKLVRKAATEAMCNLVPHEEMLNHLKDPENLRVWLALASDYEEHYECARAAAGCLAMATQIPDIATPLVELKTFRERLTTLLESGRLELMHRTLVLILNLVTLGGQCRAAATEAGLVAFCTLYLENYHDGVKAESLGFDPKEAQLMPVTVDLAKQIVRACD